MMMICVAQVIVPKDWIGQDVHVIPLIVLDQAAADQGVKRLPWCPYSKG